MWQRFMDWLRGKKRPKPVPLPPPPPPEPAPVPPPEPPPEGGASLDYSKSSNSQYLPN